MRRGAPPRGGMLGTPYRGLETREAIGPLNFPPLAFLFTDGIETDPPSGLKKSLYMPHRRGHGTGSRARKGRLKRAAHPLRPIPGRDHSTRYAACTGPSRCVTCATSIASSRGCRLHSDLAAHSETASRSQPQEHATRQESFGGGITPERQRRRIAVESPQQRWA